MGVSVEMILPGMMCSHVIAGTLMQHDVME